MTTSNKSFPITPGSGDTTAGFTVGSANFQAMVLAGPGGHMLGSRPTYLVQTPASVQAQNKHHLTIWNGAGSGVELTVLALMAQKNMAAVTGVPWELDIIGITAENGTPGGTLLTVKKLALANPSLPAQVVCRNGPANPTENAVNMNFVKWLHSEETNVAAQLQEALPIWPPDCFTGFGDRQELTLAEGQGITVKQITSTVVATYYFAALLGVK